ncbi:unnamed protein product [Rhizoctonia solani]|uniref:Uncharacterized protein n=1 Tax=Rhizoctonia solani TaxID=456999 RepID=A0A8H3HXQ1_9AGAM|nr:unnamed protein product [Rhizoctonia solani]
MFLDHAYWILNRSAVPRVDSAKWPLLCFSETFASELENRWLIWATKLGFKIYSHVHFPVINILTCRRPLGPHIMKLIRQAQSLKVASSEPVFYTDLNRHLGCLLDPRTRLDRLEIYGEAYLPHVDSLGVLADFVPRLPKAIRTLTATLPGGRPSIAGIGSFFSQISPDLEEDHPLPQLEHLHLSMQLPLQVALSPAELALPLARRLPNLELIAITPHKGSQSAVPLHLGDPGGHGWGMNLGKVEVWKVRRSARWQTASDDREQDQITSILQITSMNV